MAGMDEQDPDRTKVAIVDPLVGTVLDRRYRIEFRLAAGGFGAIYRATHVINRRAVALKVLHTSLATERDVVARFRREAQALGALRCRHTITAYDFGETADGIEERLGAEYGDNARRAASAIESTANSLASKDPDELIEDTRNFVRNSPGVAIAGAAIVGFVVARLFKSGLASNRDDDEA